MTASKNRRVRRLESRLERAKQALRNRQFERARKQLDKLLEANYRPDYVWYIRAFASETRRESQYCLEQACRLNPEFEPAQSLLEKLREIEADESRKMQLEGERQAKREKLMSESKPSLIRGTFIGQSQITSKLTERIGRARPGGRPLDHLLLIGPREMGKATLAEAISYDMGVNLTSVKVDSHLRPGDLAAMLTNLNHRDILLIEECHKITDDMLPILIEAMAEFSLDLTIGIGSSARDIRLDLPHFTFIGTTSRPSLVDRRIARWAITCNFKPYSLQEMAEIVRLIAARMGYEAHADAAQAVASVSRVNPAEARAIVRRLGPYVQDPLTTQRSLEDLGYAKSDVALPDIAEYISDLSGDELEIFIQRVFYELGYQAERVGQTGDHGIDVLLKKGREVIAIQCKRWDGSVGEPVVRDFYGSLMHSEAGLGCIIATCAFTEPARAFASDKPIKLIDLDGLVQIIVQSNLEHLVQEFTPHLPF